MNKKINTTVAIVTTIIIVGGVATAIWLSENKQNQEEELSLVQITEKDSSINVVDTTPTSKENQPNSDPVNFKTYQDKEQSLEFQYPQSWRKSEFGSGVFFLREPEINVLQLKFEKVSSTTTSNDFAVNFIKQHDCKNSDVPETGDHVIEKTNVGVYFAEFCSAGTEVYHYVTKLNSSTLLDFAYQENFEYNWTEAKKIEILKQIISTLKIKK